ncbi:MAG: hypothetical protein HUU45_15445, partial [Leptospiraceae bacterium]|nr:hypothetical protein [Leptospiraceae bacterium]
NPSFVIVSLTTPEEVRTINVSPDANLYTDLCSTKTAIVTKNIRKNELK